MVTVHTLHWTVEKMFTVAKFKPNSKAIV